MNSTELFGLKIYTAGKKNVLRFIDSREGKIHIISGNAEILKWPLMDNQAFKMFAQKENIIIPDGISICYPLKKKSINCKKIPGIELMQLLLADCERSSRPVYFLGAKQEVVDKMIDKFIVIYPKLKIAGYHHGYFDKDNCKSVVDDIKQSRAFALFVAFGTPAQERFIFKYMKVLPCKLFMGVGGSFEVLSGSIKRSPPWMCAMGIEWLYRLIDNPAKISRLWNNIIFTLKAFIYG
jgi:N-acetylglucosaminyldiphosphoundecaprenol N-acetyl-beta-D-mannosaminyltransferase